MAVGNRARSALIDAAARIEANDGRLSADSSMSLDQALDDFDEALRVITGIAQADALDGAANVLVQEARYQEEMRQRHVGTADHGRHEYARDRASEMFGALGVFVQSALIGAGVLKVEALKPDAEPPSAQDG